MNAKHFIHLCTVAVLFQNKFSYVESTEIAEGPMQGMNIFRQTGDACEPWERLYEGESKTTDIDTIEQEAEALEYLFNTRKWENPGDSKRNLVTNISSVLLKSPKLIYNGSATTFTNALGVLGGFWSIIADNFNASLNEMAGDLLRRSMHEGMKRINNDVKRKQEELDASSNKVEELELLLEVYAAHFKDFLYTMLINLETLTSSLFQEGCLPLDFRLEASISLNDSGRFLCKNTSLINNMASFQKAEVSFSLIFLLIKEYGLLYCQGKHFLVFLESFFNILVSVCVCVCVCVCTCGGTDQRPCVVSIILGTSEEFLHLRY